MTDKPIDYSKQACHSEACAIQNCLQRRGYDESKCTVYIDQLYACCASFYRQQQDEYLAKQATSDNDDNPFAIGGSGKSCDNQNNNNNNIVVAEESTVGPGFTYKRTVSCPVPALLQLKIAQRLADAHVDARLADVVKHSKAGREE
ncbi:uncharacterized protein SAPINGB_P004840 [Magnusiomyces paraingens]|uniref:Cx9C motif-containing protein 4, mitochondrial n=1 Tax=Magnusiomyces paraingens TaxID=2606893 RepID=A0A5E8BWW2_9ASCO|nr:uncharacterized protein SAPINGB_P004840 [Saprochaete ingens]VVT56129.1 unnamed protein product [Saprochaete ingens]